MEISRLVFLSLTFSLASALYAHADDPAKADKPKKDGRPVYYASGKIVVFPEGVDEPAADYKGSIGIKPLALIKLKDKIVGEVYVSPLKRPALEEAKGEGKIKLQNRTTIKKDKEDVEIVTLRLEMNNKVGTPWIFHNLYFPQGKGSVSFKLVASEERFKEVLPLFETMLFYDEKGTP